ncbi:SusD/RagB family nutrient-binding outer membrane lipoprotein [Pedobacter sp. MC2016-14]|uniref:SusD/RagB family nutrient-binding outer membrane lipoprotein n=1 Tax=Pedobacter sp. MC2016-14 TaxID=2897327 RepID=UPI001E58CE3B|nr:SusD/RagB family nutrient-binding outer membrane lipoprotein [Pedobacter sp. MC2016-14]MCD0488166.1 SusD/RagB family nutrient-binding outer membrane lipoprotein [Pedobacter sp. MC2016-14]
MKTHLYKMLLAAGIILFSISSCKKFGDTNIDPTRSSNMDPSVQLTTAQLRFSGDLNVNERTSFMMTMPLVQHIAGSYSNRWGGIYFNSPNVMGVLWEDSYGSDLVNIIDAVKRTTDVAAQSNLNAVCRIMKVYSFARMTDLYGDIPYSEAGLGIKAKFDTQAEIYDSFFRELTAASVQLNTARDAVKGDIFYNGDINAWKKFANSLHLRLAMRLVKINPTKAKTEAQLAFNAGVFTSNADICKTVHEDIQNPYEEVGKGNIKGNGVSASFFNGGAVPGRFTTPFLNQLNSTNDPRMKYMVKNYVDLPGGNPLNRIDITEPLLAVTGGYFGVNPGNYIWDDFKSAIAITVPGVGAYSALNNDQKAQPANFLLRFNAPFLHLTYAEVELLLAEATFRFGATFGGTASSHYQKGIEAAMLQLSLFPGGPTIPSTEINAFLQGNALIAGRELELINTQLWITLFLNGPEAYANWRRSGFPVLTPGTNAEEPGESLTIPRRFEYPYTEEEQNRVNFEKVLPALGGVDSWNGRVWWDKL